MHKNKSSQYIGVSKRKSGKKWRAASVFEGKRFSIGMFDSERDAAIAVDVFRIKKGLRAINILMPK